MVIITIYYQNIEHNADYRYRNMINTRNLQSVTKSTNSVITINDQIFRTRLAK